MALQIGFTDTTMFTYWTFVLLFSLNFVIFTIIQFGWDIIRHGGFYSVWLGFEICMDRLVIFEVIHLWKSFPTNRALIWFMIWMWSLRFDFQMIASNWIWNFQWKFIVFRICRVWSITSKTNLMYWETALVLKYSMAFVTFETLIFCQGQTSTDSTVRILSRFTVRCLSVKIKF